MKKVFAFWILLGSIWLPLLFLSGCDDAGDSTQPLRGTVHGKVVNDYGSPLSGAKVACFSGGTQIVTTSSDGTFSFGSVSVPYDMYLVYGGKAVVYKDVKAMSPLLNTFNNTSELENHCRIDLTIPAVNADQVFSAWFVDTTGVVQADSSVKGSNHMSFEVGWQGVNVMIGRVRALVYTVDGNEHPVTYEKYGEKTAALVNTGICTLSMSDNELNINPGEITINCQIFVPSGVSNVSSCLYISSKPFYSIYDKGLELYGSTQNSLNYSIIAPDSGSKFKYYLMTTCSNNNISSSKITSIQPGNSVITLENPPVLLEPPNNTNGIKYTSQFTFFSDNNNGLYRTVFTDEGSSSYSVSILSKTPDTKIPNLEFLGIVPDVQKTYNWKVYKYSNLNNIDDFVLNNFALNPLIISFCSSETRSFIFSANP